MMNVCLMQYFITWWMYALCNILSHGTHDDSKMYKSTVVIWISASRSSVWQFCKIKVLASLWSGYLFTLVSSHTEQGCTHGLSILIMKLEFVLSQFQKFFKCHGLILISSLKTSFSFLILEAIPYIFIDK